MSKTAKDYKITFPYGATGAPYGTKQNPYHRGDDRAMPIGTPVVVNGVQIGLSGATGWVTGPHVHVGKWINGRDYNPKGQGFEFKNAVVTEVHPWNDGPNGKFVRLQADGASWVYLHLTAITCKVGQKLRVKAPLPIPTRKFYVIRKGDTVDSISHHFKLDLRNNYQGFRKLNPGVRNINWIYVNQKVRVK